MMLGGFVALSLIANLGLNYWVGAVLAIAIMAVFGFCSTRSCCVDIISPTTIHPVIMLALGPQFIFRAFASITFGYGSYTFATPFTQQGRTLRQASVIGQDSLSIVVGTVILCAILYLFFSKTRLGIAIQAASAANSLRISAWASRFAPSFHDLGDQRFAASCVAGILLAPSTLHLT